MEVIQAQAELSLTRVQFCSISLTGTGQDAGDGVHPDHSRQGEVINQVQGPLREPRQRWAEYKSIQKVHGPSRK